MNRRYKVSLRGTVPPDLAERISEAHAAAIESRQRSAPDLTARSPRAVARSTRAPRPIPRA